MSQRARAESLSTSTVPDRRPRGAARASAGAEVTRLHGEIRRLRNLNNQIIASIHHPLAVVDPQLRISSASDAFLAMFPGLADGANLAEFFNPDGLTALIAEVAESGAARIDVEMAIEGTAGGTGEGADSTRTFRVSALSLTGKDEMPLVLLTIDEMTELRIREAQLLESSRLVAVGEIAASVAHELNNPLTAVLGFSQLALNQEMDDVLRRDVEAIASEARRAGRIVDNLLSFARHRGSEMKIFDPGQAVQHVLDLRQYECKMNNIEVVKYFDETTPRTIANLHQMQQVFLNVLNNSVQAITEHHGHGTITVGVVGIGDNIRITFADDGPGIPEDVRPRIFDPFFTTKPIGKGTGLGLSICRSIVEAHGGTIRVNSRPGKGTTFTIEIPVVEVEDEPEDLHLLQETIDPRSTMLRVLVVDDDPAVTDFLTRALRSSGHEVETASDGADALRLIYVNDYDAIILDVKMPGLGGPEVYRCVHSIRPDVASRILFVSGDFASPDARSFIESTGNAMLRKPFTLDDLRRRMDLFAKTRMERTAASDVA